jgi:hypothetical protein
MEEGVKKGRSFEINGIKKRLRALTLLYYFNLFNFCFFKNKDIKP